MGDFFGNGGGQRGERDVARGADIVMELWVTLEELYVGNFVEVSIYKKKLIIVHISSFGYFSRQQFNLGGLHVFQFASVDW